MLCFAQLREPKISGPLIACWAFCTGCALMPGVPAGPIAATGVRAGGGYGFAYAPATVRAAEPGGASRTLQGNSAMFAGRYPSILPLRLGVRFAPSRWLDLGVDYGLRESGIQVRAGELDASRALPWGFELEWRTGLTSLDDQALAYQRNIVRLRAEAYPALPFGRSESGAAYGFGVLALGVSTGTQLSTVNSVPGAYDETIPVLGQASFDALRRETRLESALGLQWLSQPHAYTLVFLPWWKLQQGDQRELTCSGCTLDVSSIETSWGFGFALNCYWQVE